MDFADFIAPMPLERFMADHFGRRPLHLKAEGEAGERRRALLSWPRLGDLLSILPHWTEANIKLILDGQPVAPAHYMIEAETASGRVPRASPAQVETFLAMGASLVADGVEDIAPEIKAATAMLSAQFAGKAGANAYCSFQGIQAFPSHCDLHEVFAVHCEGEKIWRVYKNRAADPVAQIEGEGAQAIIDRVKGRVMMKARMQPGDLLYIPRGYYHDALASAEASLHLSLAVLPHTGRILFRKLEELAMKDPAFRAYLPDGRQGGGGPLRARLEELAGRIGDLMRTPRFATEVILSQRALADPPHDFDLPNRPALDFHARTERAARVVDRDEDSFLQIGDEEIALGDLAEPAAWLLDLPAFSTQQLLARYPWRARAELEALATLLRDKQLFTPYRPSLH